MEKDLHKRFKNRKIKKPNKILARIITFAFNRICKKNNVEFVYEEDFVRMHKKQMIVLVQHKSTNDYIYVFAGLKKDDVHVLCGYQNVFQKYLYTLLEKLGVIAKMLYQVDVQATRQILQAVKLGDSVMVFPEGIQSTSGSTHPINPATINLLAKLKLPVALVKIKGSYFSRTRYSKDVKKGKITVTYTKLFSEKDFEQQTKEQLYQKMLDNFKYNEFEEYKAERVPFIGKQPNIFGLDNIIYKCPHCGSEYEFLVEGDKMKCKSCDFTISMDEYYDIHAVNKTLPFNNIDEWYKWQRKIISNEIKSDEFCLSATCKLGKINTKKLGDNYSLMNIGEGVLTLTNKGLLYEGTRENEKVKLFFEASAVYSLTMSLAYDFDLYYKNEYFNFKLTSDEKKVAKWMLAAEEIHNLYDDSWRKASEEVYEY